MGFDPSLGPPMTDAEFALVCRFIVAGFFMLMALWVAVLAR